MKRHVALRRTAYQREADQFVEAKFDACLGLAADHRCDFIGEAAGYTCSQREEEIHPSLVLGLQSFETVAKDVAQPKGSHQLVALAKLA